MLTEPLSAEVLNRLDRLVIGIARHQELTERINQLAREFEREAGLPLRLIPEYHAALMGNDISQLMFSHKLQTERERAEAMERLGGVAA